MYNNYISDYIESLQTKGQIVHFCVPLVPEVMFEELLPFFDLSSVAGVQELSRTQDSHSGAIYIPGGLVYGNEIATSIYVSNKLLL